MTEHFSRRNFLSTLGGGLGSIALTDLMVPEAVMFPTSTRDGVTTYRVRTRDAQRSAALNGIVERGFNPQAMVNGGVAIGGFHASGALKRAPTLIAPCSR